MKLLRTLSPIFFGLVAAVVFLPISNAQGVAPAVSLMVNGNPVSSSNPLPVSGGSTSAPQLTPSPTASGGIAISGSFPYTIFASPLPSFPLSIANGGTGTAAPSPQVTATACAASPALTGTWPAQTLEVPAGCGSAGGAFVRSGSFNSWLAYVETLSSVTHIWPGNDTPTCNTVQDVVASGATAVPSPVPLATASSGPGLTCGGGSISHDTNTSVNYNGTTAVSYLIAPSSVLPGANASWSVCAVVKSEYGGNFSAGSTHAIVWAFESSGANLNYDYFSSGTEILNIAAVNQSAVYDPGNVEQLHCLTVNGSTKQDTFYINGTTVYQATSSGSIDAADGLDFGNGVAVGGQNWPMAGRMCCFLLADAVLTQAQIQAMTQALGF